MSATLLEFADLLEADIRRRGLCPGNRYLTAEESADLLGTSVATANRALKVLAEKNIVSRRRNAGTFVGPAVSGVTVPTVRIVSVLVPASLRGISSVRFDLLINAIMEYMPDVGDVRISYVPATSGVEFVRSLLEPVRLSGELVGVLATSCSRGVYQFLHEQDYPFVVQGSLYPDQPYPSIDTDEYQAGKLLADYLVERGHRRLAMFSDSENCPGDSHFHDGVSEVLTAAKLPHNSLIVRAPGRDLGVLKAQIDELLSLGDPPTGLIVRLPGWADDVKSIVIDHGLQVPEDVEIVFKGFALGETGKSFFPHACPSLSSREIASRTGQMLATVRDNQAIEKSTVVIPYEMRTAPELGVVD